MERAGHHKKRMINIEVLRLLAMMMVVSLHYLAKGELLEKLTGPLSAKGHLAWILEIQLPNNICSLLDIFSSYIA